MFGFPLPLWLPECRLVSGQGVRGEGKLKEKKKNTYVVDCPAAAVLDDGILPFLPAGWEVIGIF